MISIGQSRPCRQESRSGFPSRRTSQGGPCYRGDSVMANELERELTNLKQGDHICLIYENAAEQLAAAVPFVKEGLARGERCTYIADDRSVEEVVQALTAAGLDVAQERQ